MASGPRHRRVEDMHLLRMPQDLWTILERHGFDFTEPIGFTCLANNCVVYDQPPLPGQAILADMHLPKRDPKKEIEPRPFPAIADRGDFADFLGEIRSAAWTIALPIAFLIVVTFLSCGGGLALFATAWRP